MEAAHACTAVVTHCTAPLIVCDLQARKEADEMKARAQMEAAIAGSAAAGATWGMSMDDDDENEDGPAKEVNWRSYVDKHGGNLTDRQTKLLDKIR
jgi:hypothetical protein